MRTWKHGNSKVQKTAQTINQAAREFQSLWATTSKGLSPFRFEAWKTSNLQSQDPIRWVVSSCGDSVLAFWLDIWAAVEHLWIRADLCALLGHSQAVMWPVQWLTDGLIRDRNTSPCDSVIRSIFFFFFFLACMKQHMENKRPRPTNEDLVGAHSFQDVRREKRKSFVNHTTPTQTMIKQTKIHILLTDMREFFMGCYYKCCCAETHLLGPICVASCPLPWPTAQLQAKSLATEIKLLCFVVMVHQILFKIRLLSRNRQTKGDKWKISGSTVSEAKMSGRTLWLTAIILMRLEPRHDSHFKQKRRTVALIADVRDGQQNKKRVLSHKLRESLKSSKSSTRKTIPSKCKQFYCCILTF